MQMDTVSTSYVYAGYLALDVQYCIWSYHSVAVHRSAEHVGAS